MITRQIILESFKTVRQHTMEIARDIPAEKYDFRPVEGSSSVIEHFLDIIQITQFMVEAALTKEPIHVTFETRNEVFARVIPIKTANVTTKDEVIILLEQSLESIVSRVEAADEAYLNETFIAPDRVEKVRLWVINCAKEQEMARRAQLFLIERMLGIIPHTTRRQKAAEAMVKK
ncbi:MAG: DinB family protein [Sumerlaeia bacterium]